MPAGASASTLAVPASQELLVQIRQVRAKLGRNFQSAGGASAVCISSRNIASLQAVAEAVAGWMSAKEVLRTALPRIEKLHEMSPDPTMQCDLSDSRRILS